ncbi:discoidin domain-containing protein [Flavobacterium psychrotrophum]|uniref:discoidin domain-containing protein n=1 Tax=Flavobacterium psychrotrophum TaxID=2294119 RepID=UPI000E322AC8|nr:discoidin domain-containing protein [Flavobacterium psychrotrophum]
MKKRPTNFILIYFLLRLLCTAAFAQSNMLNLDSSNPLTNWKVYPADQVTNTAPVLQPGYDTSGWVTATVPGTVFAAYVAQGFEENPDYGDNIYRADRTKYNKNFWYRTELAIPASLSGNRKWLNLEGVNRDADVYFNGHFLGNIKGILQRGKYDITSFINTLGSNALAILVYLPQGALNCSASPTYIPSASWDWMPYVPGLNSGITNDIYISTSNEVTINDPWIRTKVLSEAVANLKISAELKNNSGKAITGVLSGTIMPGNIPFSKTVTIPANGTVNAVTELTVNNPQLWWPNGYGAQNLYTCNFEFKKDGTVSDQKNVTFGIREYSYDTTGDVFHLYINGKKIFLKGGNWGMSEYMLRCKKDEYDTKIRLHKEMNYNVIRNWTGATTDEEFYEACDKHGIMVWDDFWLITTYFNWPDFEVFRNNVAEKIKRNRNYASIALWCGANEMTPPDDYVSMYRSAVNQYDGDDRWFQPNSNHGSMSGSGPWQNFHPAEYFNTAPRMPGAIESYGMRSELGTAVFPNYDSFQKFMPEANQWPRNTMWEQHFFGDTYAPAANANKFFETVNNYYGNCSSIQEFCKKSQLVNIQVNQAMYEGWLHNLNNDASGLIIWMSQSAYPSMLWQTYDYYYDLNGAYWGVKAACEPVHILKVPTTGKFEVVNTSGAARSWLNASLEIVNLHGETQYTFQANLPELAADAKVADVFGNLNIDTARLTQVYFERLRLTDASGAVVSENFYWPTLNENNYNYVNTLHPVTLTVAQQVQAGADETVVTATISNPVQETAFAVRVQLVNPATGQAILPAFIDKGYFTLFPGESKLVTIKVRSSQLQGITPQVKATPYNDPEMGLIQNLALFKPTTVSSTFGTINTAGKATDGSYATRWESNYSDPQWLMTDLLEQYQINRIKIKWEGARASKYSIDTSTDGINWTVLQMVDNNTELDNEFNGLSVNARYVRVSGIQRASVWGYSIYELEVYGQAVLASDKPQLNDKTAPYPNPFKNSISIPLPLNMGSTFEIELRDASGRLVAQHKGKNLLAKTVFDWEPTTKEGGTLASGVYFLALKCNRNTTTYKIIKQ